MRIRNAQGEVLHGEDVYNFDSDLWEYLEARVPAPAPDQKCELEYHADCGPNGEREDAFATTFFYTIKDDHICYTYVCTNCAENSVEDYDPPFPEDVPTTEEGYVQEPVHCSS